MHRFVSAGLLMALFIYPRTASAQDDRGGQVQVFGGAVVRDLGSAPVFGGAVAVTLTDHLQVAVEGGRFSDMMSPTLATLLDFTPVDVRLSALYGQAGIRVIASPGRAARPYGEAAFGFARMSTDFDGSNPDVEAIVDAALQFLDRTEPVVSLGGGVVLQGGPVFIDLGYRFTKVVSDNPVQSLLTGGDLRVNQFRAGLGVRF